MYTGLLHSHKVFVILFLLHYVFKLVLLLANRKEQLERYSKTMKIPEMVLSVGFLVSGGWMLISAASFSTFIIVKLVCVFTSIPLAVIGFKKSNKIFASAAVLLIITAYGLAEMNKAKQKKEAAKTVDTSSATNPIEVGKIIYTEKCVICHGGDGKLGASGAKDLSVTQLSIEEQKAIIRNGKTNMAPYPVDAISDEQLDALTQYLATLKQ